MLWKRKKILPKNMYLEDLVKASVIKAEAGSFAEEEIMSITSRCRGTVSGLGIKSLEELAEKSRRKWWRAESNKREKS